MDFDKYHIPLRMRSSISDYVNERGPVGGFLTAVLENNLKEAVAYADDLNSLLLPNYVRFFYNECPAACWGSTEKVRAWLNPELENQE